ncbi:MAG: chorismate mutase [Flavobacteriales bacterium]
MKIKLNNISDYISSSTKPLVIAGPCSAESNIQMLSTAKELAKTNTHIFRAGIWKPRTRPNSFEGIGTPALEWMNNVQKETGLKVITEVANSSHVDQILKHNIDMIWIGARTAGNPFAIQEIVDSLKGVDIPIFIKNPLNADLNLWLGAIERFYNAGFKNIIAIHRGFFSYGVQKYRNVPQWQLPVELKRLIPDLPIFCDPSHIAGNRTLINEISQTALDLNFDGLMIETHIDPVNALSDKEQQLSPIQLKELLENLVIRSQSVTNQDTASSLRDLRSQIDKLDDKLINVLQDRMDLAELIGIDKKTNDITILQPERWKYILEDRLKKGVAKGLSDEFIILLLRAIHQESINIQTRVMNSNK